MGNNPVNDLKLSPTKTKQNNPIIVSINGVEVRKNDLNKLFQDEKINDSVVDSILSLKQDQNPTSLYVDSKIVSKMILYGEKYSNIELDHSEFSEKTYFKRILQDEKFTSYEKIYFPFCNDDHWILFVYNLIDKKMYNYDSISEFNENAIQSMNSLYYVLTKVCLKDLHIPEYISGKCQLQTNCIDCGIHVISNALAPESGEGDIQFRIGNNYREYLYHSITNKTLVEYVNE